MHVASSAAAAAELIATNDDVLLGKFSKRLQSPFIVALVLIEASPCRFS